MWWWWEVEGRTPIASSGTFVRSGHVQAAGAEGRIRCSVYTGANAGMQGGGPAHAAACAVARRVSGFPVPASLPHQVGRVPDFAHAPHWAACAVAAIRRLDSMRWPRRDWSSAGAAGGSLRAAGAQWAEWLQGRARRREAATATPPTARGTPIHKDATRLRKVLQAPGRCTCTRHMQRAPVPRGLPRLLAVAP